MHFLLDANLPRSLGQELRSRGLMVTDVRDAGLGTAEDEEIAAFAQRNGMAILTRDFDFADIRNYQPANFAAIVVVDFPNGTSAVKIVGSVADRLTRPGIFVEVAGRLAVIQPARVRLR